MYPNTVIAVKNWRMEMPPIGYAILQSIDKKTRVLSPLAGNPFLVYYFSMPGFPVADLYYEIRTL